jgi:DNA-binding GntR family transcriptional regulator
VVPSATTDSYVHHAMSINDLIAFVAGTRFVLESIGMVAVDARLAARISVKIGEEWLAVRGYRHADGVDQPVCMAEYYIHRDFAAIGRLLPRHNGPIFPLIEDMFAVSIAEVHQEIGAVALEPPLAEILGMSSGSPALEVLRTYRIANGTLAQITVNTHPASRFRHSMTMRRVKG